MAKSRSKARQIPVKRIPLKSLPQQRRRSKRYRALAARWRDVILGAQDGLVNILGLSLGVAAATWSSRLVMIAGLAGTFAESISMAAVAYTSTKTAMAFVESEELIHNHRSTLMYPAEFRKPMQSAVIVGIASVVGSLIPLIPFFFFTAKESMVTALGISGVALFFLGAVKAKLTIGDWKKSGFEILAIGLLAALAGYVVGRILGVVI